MRRFLGLFKSSEEAFGVRIPELCHASAVPMPRLDVTGVAPWQSCWYALLVRMLGMHSFHI